MKNAVILAALLTIAFASAARPQKVKVMSEAAVDFTKYTTYAFQPPRTLKGDEAFENEYVVPIITAAIQEALKTKGMEEDTESPDVQIVFYVGVDQKSRVDNFQHWSSRGRYRTGVTLGQALNKVPTYHSLKGVLAIDIVDATTETLVWRAYCWGNIKGMEDRNRKISKAVEKAFRKYPPKSRGG